jgi:hypothetical protein
MNVDNITVWGWGLNEIIKESHLAYSMAHRTQAVSAYSLSLKNSAGAHQCSFTLWFSFMGLLWLSICSRWSSIVNITWAYFKATALPTCPYLLCPQDTPVPTSTVPSPIHHLIHDHCHDHQTPGTVLMGHNRASSFTSRIPESLTEAPVIVFPTVQWVPDSFPSVVMVSS